MSAPLLRGLFTLCSVIAVACGGGGGSEPAGTGGAPQATGGSRPTGGSSGYLRPEVVWEVPGWPREELGYRIASTLWLISNVDAIARVVPLPPGGPLGLVFGLLSLLPDVVLMVAILKHFWLKPLERQAQAWLEE